MECRKHPSIEDEGLLQCICTEISAVPLRLLFCKTAACERTVPHTTTGTIRRPVNYSARPCTTGNGAVPFCSRRLLAGEGPLCLAVASHQTSDSLKVGVQRVMSCSLHLPNDCVYFSPVFINCQYILSKLGDSAIFEKFQLRIFRRFSFRCEMNKTWPFVR